MGSDSPHQLVVPDFTTPIGGLRFTTPTGGSRFTTPTGGARFTTPIGGLRFTTPTGGARFHHTNWWGQIHHTNWWGQIHHTNWWGKIHHTVQLMRIDLEFRWHNILQTLSCTVSLESKQKLQVQRLGQFTGNIHPADNA